MTAARLNLHVGALTRRPGTGQAVQRILQEVAGPIVTASGQDIRLTVIDEGTVVVPGMPGEGQLPSETLHSALERMTGDQIDVSRIKEIGLLVADRFEPAPGFFGMMFDDAFQPGSSSPWRRKAREGCAVFLGGIDDGRAAADRLDEVVFTAVHELAHVFNLQHGSRPSYMFQSAIGGQIPLATAAFSAHESSLLAKCSTSDHIHPGNSAFGDLGDLATATQPGTPTNAPVLSLRIGLQQRRFWHFEPIELDVELSTASPRPLIVPDTLDCGYASFRVWIEEPDGARRFLRSPRHYCSQRGTLRVSSGDPFRRDISLFGESGGYTFGKAGFHRVQASFELPGRRTIVSNVVEFEVLPQRPGDAMYVDAQRMLTIDQVAKVLYYRRLTPPRMRRLRELQEFCGHHPRHPASAMVHYCAGRALERTVVHRAARRTPDAGLLSAARDHLKQAARRSQLGEHRQQRAEEALARLSAV